MDIKTLIESRIQEKLVEAKEKPYVMHVVFQIGQQEKKPI